MKKSLAVICLTASLMTALLTGISTLIVGWRIIAILAKGIINPSLCLEFLGITMILGVCVAITRWLSIYLNIDANNKPEIKIGPDSKFYNPDE